ncbi:hypothetical protein B0H13DRAFT_1851398 [Mycena leptocephala]|nr:hypothetical protein B0H13DRAFT_1851398 [Mycena leptocephala]
MPEGLDAPKDREFAGTESVAELAPDGGPPDNPLKAEDVPGSDMVCFASPDLIIEFMVEYPDEDATPDYSLPEIGEINGGELLKPGPYLKACPGHEVWLASVEENIEVFDSGLDAELDRWILDLEGEDRRVGELSLGVFNDVGP